MKINKILKNITHKNYCNMKNYKYYEIQKKGIQKIYKPNYGEESLEKNFIETEYPEIYIDELENVNIIGENYIVFDEDNYCIYDMPFLDKKNKFNLTFNNTIDINEKNTLISYDDELVNEIDEGIMLTNSVRNYSHFNLEIISRICLINDIKKYKDIPLLVNEDIFEVPQLIEELSLVINGSRKVIPVKKGCLCKVKKLIYISDLAIMPFNIKRWFEIEYEDTIISDLCINLLRKTLNMKYEYLNQQYGLDDEDNISKKLFISRDKSHNLRLENQDEVESIFKEYGYEIIFPEKMSFLEQLKIFSKSECIAGAGGAGLTNILLSNDNTKFICISPKEVKATYFSSIVGILGQEQYFLDAKISKKYNDVIYYARPYTIDTKYLREFLENIN